MTAIESAEIVIIEQSSHMDISLNNHSVTKILIPTMVVIEDYMYLTNSNSTRKIPKRFKTFKDILL